MPLTQIKDGVIQNLNANKVTGAFTTDADGSRLTGLSAVDWDLRYNLAINYFNDSVRENFDRSGLDQGWIDVFKDTDDVDGEGVTVYTAKFVDDIYRKTGGLNGLVNGTNGVFFCRINFKGNDGTEQLIVRNGSSRFKIYKNASNKIGLQMTDVNSQATYDASSNDSYTASSHDEITILMAWNSSNFKIYINDQEAQMTAQVPMTGQACDYVSFSGGTPSPWGIMGHPVNDSTHCFADISQLFLDLENTLDIDVEANRRLFTESASDNYPLDLTNVLSPILYFNSSGSQWGEINHGSGGNFSLGDGSGAVDGGSVSLGATEGSIYDSGANSFSNSYELIDSHGKEHYSTITDFQSAVSSSNAQANIISLPDCVITRLSVYGKARTSANGNVFAFIRGVASGTIAGNDAVPDENIIATSTKTVSSLPTSLSVIHFDFPEPVVLTAGEYAIGTECTSTVGGFDRATTRSSNYSGGGGSDTIDADTFHAIRLNASGWINTSTTSPPFSDNAHQNQPFYLYGHKNLDLITKGSDDIGNSPSTAPTKGHMEVLVDDRISDLTISDISSSSHNINTTAGTTNVIKTADNNAPKTHSLFFSGSSKLRITRTSDFDFGTSPVTIEFWTKCSNPQSDRMIACGTHPDEWFIRSNSQAGEAVKTNFNGVVKSMSFGSNLWADGNWHHLALVRNDDTLKLYVDGTVVVPLAGMITGLSGQTWTIASGQDIGIGSGINGGSTEYYSGNLDEIRISRAALYTSNFTPSTAPFTSNASTVLLISPSTFSYTYPTLNTNIIGQISRNGGGSDASNWTDIPLKRIKTQVGGSPNNLLVGNATLTSTTGTNIVGRIKTANKDKITVQGISVNWS